VRRLAGVAVALAVLLTGRTRMASAQASTQASSLPAAVWQPAPTGHAVRALAERRFDAAAGLRSATMYAMAFDTDGRPWVGAEDGLFRYAGSVWRAVALPEPFAGQQVRSLLFARDSTLWIGTRQGILHRHRDGRMEVYREADGVPGSVAYSLTESDAIDGTPRVVVGASRGAAWFDGTRFRALPLDGAAPWVGVMVSAGVRANGSHTLWLASSAGGVATVERGRITRYGAADGLDAPDAQFVRPIAGDSAVEAYVATADGLFAATRRGEVLRFARVPGSPREVFRIEAMQEPDGRRTLWVGTAHGDVTTWDGRTWRPVPLSNTPRRTTVTLLRSAQGHGGTDAVYVGLRNGALHRVSYGAAAQVDVVPGDRPPVVTGLFVEGDGGGRDALWLTTPEDALWQVRGDGRVTRIPLIGDEARALQVMRAALAPPSAVASPRDSGGSILVLVGGVPWRVQGDRLVRVDAGLDDRLVNAVRRVPLPWGGEATLAATSRGLMQWDGARWLAVPRLGEAAVHSISAGRERSAPVLYLGGDHVVRVITPDGERAESIPRVGGAGLGIGPVLQVCRTTVNGRARLWAHDRERGVFWRDVERAGQWRLLAADVPEGAESRADAVGVSRLLCLDGGRIATASLSGVTLFDVRDAVPARWRVISQLAEPDGLPSSAISDIAPSADPRYLWVSTPYGVGLVDLVRAERAPPARLLLSVDNASDASSPDVGSTDGDTIAAGTLDDLRVDAQLLTFHREEYTRYRVSVERTRGGLAWGTRGWVGPDTGEVFDLGARVYHDLAPGTYRVRAWAYDWAGRRYGPVERTVVMHTPAWLTLPAVASYVLLLTGLLAAAYQWRVRTIRASAARVVASERRARESERRFRTLFEEAPDAHLLVAAGVVQAANGQAAAMFGVASADDLAGKRLPHLLGVPESASDADVEAATVQHVQRGDLLVPVQCTMTPLPSEGQGVAHWVLRDMTDVRRAEVERAWFEAQAREAQKLESLGTLAGGVAHDFNNLLNVIRGNAELGRNALRKGRANDDHLAAILDASDRARDIVRQILTFSRRASPERAPIDLSRLVVDLAPLLRRMLPRGVQLRLHGTDAPHVIQGDATQLQQLLLNLVSNAEYALRARGSGTIDITLADALVADDQPAPTGAVVVLQVADDGAGMTDTVRERIFEPFFTTKPTGEGTGLGMAVVHGIVASHAGHPEVASAPDAGTTFSFRFPAVTDAEEEIDPEILAEAEAARRLVEDHDEPSVSLPVATYDVTPSGRTCVVVDDEPMVASVIARALEDQGHRVEVFHAPELALETIRARPHAIDVPVTDLTMPGMTGEQLAVAVHAVRADLPVLIVTGFSQHLTEERVAAAGVFAVLQKPVALAELARAVHNAMQARR